MGAFPEFPVFRPVELDDRDIITDILHKYRPGISELTYTNLFIWRKHYNFLWSVHANCLCIVGKEGGGPWFGMAPAGATGRIDSAVAVLEWLRDTKSQAGPSIERADESLSLAVPASSRLQVEEKREHFDYVYRTRDLIDLGGNKYRNKRNHINQFLRAYQSYTYEVFEERHIDACLKLQENWCNLRRCNEDLNLLGEWEAIKEILNNYAKLETSGAVICVAGEVKAFTFGEMIADDMAVIHIEKADPAIPGLYQLINQQFCARRWQDVAFVNREQDLGITGLRDAKMSYNPDHFVKKYRITLKE
ncbi:MAG: phosphatidylglycerol lysyltransferase domain-containing protein [Syntrophorhabdus sp.]